MKTAPIKILLIEDNPGDVRLIRETLSQAREATFSVQSAALLSEGLEQIGKGQIDLVLLELNLPDSQGLETFRKAYHQIPHLPIIILTGIEDEEMAVEAVRLGAQDYLVKGLVGVELLAPAIRYAIERQRVEEALKQSEKKYRHLIDNLQEGVWAIDMNAITTFVNPRMASMLGYPVEEMMGKSLFEFMDEANQKIAHNLFERRKQEITGEHDFEFLKKDGTRVYAKLAASPILDDNGSFRGALACVSDITKRKEMEDALKASERQLQQAMKMEAIGVLAGGVAHDFNNNLTPIFAICDILMKELDKNNHLWRDIKEIKEAAERCASLVKQLMAFSREQTLEPRIISLNEVAANMEKMLIRVIGEDIQLVKLLAPELGLVKADPNQVEQIIANLAANARDAMPEGGKLTLETKNVYLDEEYAKSHIDFRPGHYTMLAISDTGVGMGKSTQEHIFEPFFTTKEKGKGTGLGLSTVYGIVKQSGGSIQVYSALGKGTIFKIYLPIVAADEEKFEAPSLPADKSRGGSETILVVEDEESVRRVVKRVLEGLGYKVLEAGDGEEALKKYGQYHGPVHLLVTDVIMPGIGGKELVNYLQKKYPNLQALYISGYTDAAISHHGALEPGAFFIQKPFTVDNFTRKIREILDSSI